MRKVDAGEEPFGIVCICLFTRKSYSLCWTPTSMIEERPDSQCCHQQAAPPGPLNSVSAAWNLPLDGASWLEQKGASTHLEGTHLCCILTHDRACDEQTQGLFCMTVVVCLSTKQASYPGKEVRLHHGATWQLFSYKLRKGSITKQQQAAELVVACLSFNLAAAHTYTHTCT
eukprot:1158748-Pelagomonas_calceolata.AAC.8